VLWRCVFTGINVIYAMCFCLISEAGGDEGKQDQLQDVDGDKAPDQ